VTLGMTSGLAPMRHAGLVRALSPRHRRWRRLLSSLTLDPDQLLRPIEPPGDGDFVICGVPRSGTSLLAAILYQPPSIVTVMEPWDGMRLPPAELFASLRKEIDEIGWLGRGRLDVSSLLRAGAVRWGRDGEFPHRVDTVPEYVLGVKWPAFWRYLDELPRTKFLVCIRDPVSVISSFAKTKGRLGQGLEYSVPFNRKMNQELADAATDPSLRRILLYDYVNSRVLPHLSDPNVMVVRYERWLTDPDGLMTDLGQFLGVNLRPSPANIRVPAVPQLPPADLSLIRQHCKTAHALGYAIASSGPRQTVPGG
jgi:hypothetical protein